MMQDSDKNALLDMFLVESELIFYKEKDENEGIRELVEPNLSTDELVEWMNFLN